MLSRKTFMQLCMFIFHGVMLHVDGICYALFMMQLYLMNDCLCKMFMQFMQWLEGSTGAPSLGVVYPEQRYTCLGYKASDLRGVG